MKRLVVVVLVAALAAVAAPVFAQTTLKVATLAPEGTDAVKAINAAGQEIATATQNRVKIQVFPGGTQGKDDTILKKMKIGQIDGATFTAGGISSVYRDFQIMSLPLLFRTYDEVDHVRPQIEPIIMAGLEKAGYVPVANIEVGFAYLMSKSPVKTLGDLKGKKIWVPENDPISKTVFEEMGVPAIPQPISDVFTSLKTGILDTYANPPVGAVTLQWYTESKYVGKKPLIYIYSTLAFAKPRFDKLSPEDQATVRTVFAKHMKALDVSVRKSNEAAMQTLTKQGLQFTDFTPEGDQQITDVAQKATAKLTSMKEFSPEMVQKVQGILDAYRKSKGQ